MAGDRDIEKVISGDLEDVGSPLVRELEQVFKRHGFDGGFVFSAFALDGERWRFDSGVVIEDTVPEAEQEGLIHEAIEWIASTAEGAATGGDDVRTDD
jgi:hypothetical protein